jgi:hypothetical protein
MNTVSNLPAPLRVFIGFDDRQPLSLNVLQYSIFRRSSWPVQISPLVIEQLPITRRGLTPFTFTRFLVPWLCNYEGWALFMDCDMLVRDDIAKLFAMADDRYAVMVTKNRMRLEWASVMLFNCARCRVLTPQYVSTAEGLHGINWVQEVEIGALPPEWNHIVGYDPPRPGAANVHYSQGMPLMPEVQGCEYSSEWMEECKDANRMASWETLMGSSVHAVVVNGKKIPRLKAPAGTAELSSPLQAPAPMPSAKR